jgi:hypothetical protein
MKFFTIRYNLYILAFTHKCRIKITVGSVQTYYKFTIKLF